MINADEHKKLLAQIAQLEKNSVNYFDVAKEFFLIDSNNLSQVRSRLYGYSIQRSGIYEDDNLTHGAIDGLDGRGCYIYVGVQDGKITIKQDLNGSWGIYLFRHGDYFALSNSFFRLLDHIKFRYPLTVNRDYCHYLMIQTYASYSYSETAVNEIQLVDRSAIIHIDIAKKNFQVEMIDYKEHTLSLDSEEGIAALDRWIDFWSGVIRGIAQHTQFIQTDLSGGFDSRISLVPVLNSGVDFNKIKFHSEVSSLHTHTEDYEIASKIAEHYGFKLNELLPKRQQLNYSLTDIFNFDLYGNQAFSIIPRLWLRKGVDKLYWLSGAGGEGIRATFGESPNKFVETQYLRTKHYTRNMSSGLSKSIETILNSGFSSIQDKCKIEDQFSRDTTLYLPRDTVDRHHCGKEALNHYFMGNIRFSSIFDPELYSLKLYTSECSDSNLLMAMIYSRYEPDLLNFPFDSKHAIAPETIEYAKKINERFPFVKEDKTSVSAGETFHLQPRDTQAEKILYSGSNNPTLPANLPETCLKATFVSSRTYGLFSAYFDKELYHYAVSYYDTHDFGRNRRIYAILGVTRVLEDVEISQHNRPLHQDIKYFLNQDFATIYDDEIKIPVRLQNYLTARISIKLLTETGDFQIISLSDNQAKVSKPTWYQKKGVGYIIQSYVGNIEFVAKATVDGQIRLNLKGKKIRNKEDTSKRVPYWIDYTKLTVNGKVIFDTLTPVWYEKFYRHKIKAKAGEEIKIQIEWLPHRSDT